MRLYRSKIEAIQQLMNIGRNGVRLLEAKQFIEDVMELGVRDEAAHQEALRGAKLVEKLKDYGGQ